MKIRRTTDRLLQLIRFSPLDHLSVVQPVLNLVHLRRLYSIHNIEVLHDDSHITDDVSKHGSADYHAHDGEPSLQVIGACDVAVPYGCPSVNRVWEVVAKETRSGLGDSGVP